jgi:uncharacterized protein YuzE
MRLSYYPETDTLYIDLKEAPGADTREVAQDVVIDLDADGRTVGIEIEHASEKVNLSRLETEGLDQDVHAKNERT